MLQYGYNRMDIMLNETKWLQRNKLWFLLYDILTSHKILRDKRVKQWLPGARERREWGSSI